MVFAVDETVPELREFEKAFQEIRSEFLVASERVAVMPTYHELDPAQHYISATTPDDWRMFHLYSMGEVAEENAALCPRTMAVLKKVPHLFQASFSILDPGKSVPEHEGPFHGYLRYHLGIEVPTENPPSIRIRDHVHTWKDGESVLFDDSWNHEVTNNSAERRVVLIVDVLRPMPWAQQLANRFYTFVLRIFYGRMVLRRLRERTASATSTETPGAGTGRPTGTVSRSE
ncbi:aspartyl/asparaginyl beta-hydroxylase domain-containing protein [Actinomadura sp. 9N407]|uniref:aspartyl/asparaginyl beta-hydroxylase domain-containing protein n=1 Tax=Actinomadura sp. 9N407 TaxID=3375154 RepID=UPI00378EA6F0